MAETTAIIPEVLQKNIIWEEQAKRKVGKEMMSEMAGMTEQKIE